MIAGRVRCPVLIDRERELSRLAELRFAAARGRGSCVLLSGEAGIGKSRLLAAFRESLTGGRASFGLGLAREFGNEPYGPVRAALSGMGCGIGLAPELTLGEQLAALAQRAFDAARRRHRVLVIEDAQWADEGTLRLLLYLLPLIATMRMLLVVTFRSDELDENHAAVKYLTRFRRHAATHEIALEPLSPAALRRVLSLAMGQRSPLPARIVRDIVERSEGNPLFAEELLKAALEQPSSPRSAHELPLTIRAAVQERCAGLDAAERSVLFHAAVLGRRFEAQLLADLCSHSLSEVLAALRRLCRLQILDAPTGKSSTYAFRHALTREAVYGTMLADEVAPLHQTILSVLEKRAANAHDLGYHAWAARDAQKTVRYNEKAGDEAAAVHVDADAQRCFERALDGARDATVRGRLLEKAAAAAARAGTADRAAALYEQAALAGEATLDSERVANLYVAMSGQARLAGDTLGSREILQRAISRLCDAPAVVRARLAIQLAFTHLDRAEITAAEALAAQAEAIKESVEYANLLHYTAATRGDLVALRAAGDLYLRRCEDLGPDHVLRARFNRGFSLCTLGVDAEALTILEMLLPELRERRLPSLEVAACANAALVHARAGRWERARALVERGLEIPEPATTGPIVLAAAGLTIAVMTRDDDLARRSAPVEIVEAAFASRINSTLGRIGGPYARWLFLQGNRAGAEAALRRSVGVLGSPFAATETLLAAAEIGDETTLASSLAHLHGLDEMSALPIYAATAEHLRAFAALRNGGDAASSAGAAANYYHELGWPIHERSALELTVEVRPLQARGETRRAEATTLSARELQVAALVVRGVPNKSLAQQLAISQRTVEKHLTSIFNKLGVRNRTELVALMLRRSPHLPSRRAGADRSYMHALL